MTKYIIILFTVFIGQSRLFCQKPEKVNIDRTNYYYKLVPKAKPVGIIIILHGGSEDAKGVMNQITLDEIALKNNFIVVFPISQMMTLK